MSYIQINIKEAQQAINNLQNKLKDLSPLMLAISETMKSAVDENFETEGHGTWAETQRGGRILQDSGHLKNSINSFYNNKQAIVGTNVIYAAIHNFGGKNRRMKEALPARPFLVLNDQAIEDIQENIENFIKNIN